MDPPSAPRAHPWSAAAPAGAAFYIEGRVSEAIGREALKGARAGHEVLGLLLGDALLSGSRGSSYSVALAHATAPVKATPTHVRFDPKEFGKLAAALDAIQFDFVIVGWYHSHLGLGCFLSEIDLRTQARYFRMSHQYALVVDPIKKEARAFQAPGGESREAAFALFSNGAEGNEDYRLPRGRARSPNTGRYRSR